MQVTELFQWLMSCQCCFFPKVHCENFVILSLQSLFSERYMMSDHYIQLQWFAFETSAPAAAAAAAMQHAASKQSFDTHAFASWAGCDTREMRARMLSESLSLAGKVEGFSVRPIGPMCVFYSSPVWGQEDYTQAGFWLLGLFDSALRRMWGYFRRPDITRCHRVSPTPCARCSLGQRQLACPPFQTWVWKYSNK